MENDRTFDLDQPEPHYPEPDREAAVLAHRHMLKMESPQQRYVRQQYEVTIGALKVAMDAWRRIWPEAVAAHCPQEMEPAHATADYIEKAYNNLDLMGDAFQGETMRLVQCGHLNAEDVRNAIAVGMEHRRG